MSYCARIPSVFLHKLLHYAHSILFCELRVMFTLMRAAWKLDFEVITSLISEIKNFYYYIDHFA